MRADYADPAVREALYELLDTSFCRLAERIRLAVRLRAHWTTVSTPFVALDGGRPIAHAGVMAIPAVLAGQEIVVGGIHAVCTHPAYRRRGHFRTVMKEALDFCDRHFTSIWLFTETPDLYEPFGFRVVAEHVFVSGHEPTIEGDPGPLSGDGPAHRGVQPFRPLSARSQEDLALLHRLLEKRAAVSDRIAVVDPGWLFVMNEVLASGRLARLFYSEDLETVAAWERRGATLHLLDLVAQDVPEVAEVVRRIPGQIERVVLHFPPDPSAGGPWSPEAHAPEDRWMVRGPLHAGAGPLALSPLGRC